MCEKFRQVLEPCLNPNPKESAPAPRGGGGGAWWPKMLKFGANPPTHPSLHPSTLPPPPPPGGGVFWPLSNSLIRGLCHLMTSHLVVQYSIMVQLVK